MKVLHSGVGKVLMGLFAVFAFVALAKFQLQDEFPASRVAGAPAARSGTTTAERPFRLVAPVGKYSAARRIVIGSYHISPLIGQDGCTSFMINGVGPKKSVCKGEIMTFDYKSEEGEEVEVRIKSDESRPITFEFIPVRRSA